MNVTPSVVLPTTRLLDLDRFFSDLPKYRPFLSTEDWKSWEQFIDKSPELSQANPDVLWELPALVLAAKNLPPISQGEISEETTQLFEKETRVPSDVCDLLVNYVFSDIAIYYFITHKCYLYGM